MDEKNIQETSVEQAQDTMASDTSVEKSTETKADSSQSKTNTEIDVQEQLQKLMVENARLKKAVDKASADASDYKKKYNATLSEKEQADMAKAEAEAERQQEFENLKRQVAINELEKNFLVLGYNAEQAHKASTAQYDGDTSTLFAVQSEVQQTLIKAKEAEWLKSRPPVQAGVGGETTNITQEQFDKMGYKEQVEFKQKYPETYKKYVQ